MTEVPPQVMNTAAEPVLPAGSGAAADPKAFETFYNKAKSAELKKNPKFVVTKSWQDKTLKDYNASVKPAKEDKNAPVTASDEQAFIKQNSPVLPAPIGPPTDVPSVFLNGRAVAANAANKRFESSGYQEYYSGGKGGATYKGNNLLDEGGMISTRTAYNTSTDNEASLMYYELAHDPAKLKTVLTTLKTYNFYSGTAKPSSRALAGLGVDTSDVSAINNFLDYSTSKGKTWNAALVDVKTVPPSAMGGGSGSGGYYPSREDSAATLHSRALTLLGRTLTPAEIDVAVSRIASDYKAKTAGTGGEQPTTLTTSADVAVQKAAPADASVYATSNAINRIFQTLGA